MSKVSLTGALEGQNKERSNGTGHYANATPPSREHVRFKTVAERALNAFIWSPANFGISVRKALHIPWPELTGTRCVLIASFPKSGSTYLARVISEVTHRPKMSACPPLLDEEQDLTERQLKRCYRKAGVIQQHVKATAHNVELMQQYHLRPVVLVRNIFDVVPSFDDHLDQYGHQVPMSYVPREFDSWSHEKRRDWIIDITLPWYFNFYCSWIEQIEALGGMWMTYEQVFEDPAHAVQTILRHNGITTPRDVIERAIQASQGQYTRRNVGISGRGNSLSAAQKERVVQMASICGLRIEDRHRLGIF